MQVLSIPCRPQVTLPSAADLVRQEFERLLTRRGASQAAQALRLRCATLLGTAAGGMPRFD